MKIRDKIFADSLSSMQESLYHEDTHMDILLVKLFHAIKPEVVLHLGSFSHALLCSSNLKKICDTEVVYLRHEFVQTDFLDADYINYINHIGLAEDVTFIGAHSSMFLSILQKNNIVPDMIIMDQYSTDISPLVFLWSDQKPCIVVQEKPSLSMNKLLLDAVEYDILYHQKCLLTTNDIHYILPILFSGYSEQNITHDEEEFQNDIAQDYIEDYQSQEEEIKQSPAVEEELDFDQWLQDQEQSVQAKMAAEEAQNIQESASSQNTQDYPKDYQSQEEENFDFSQEDYSGEEEYDFSSKEDSNQYAEAIEDNNYGQQSNTVSNMMEPEGEDVFEEVPQEENQEEEERRQRLMERMRERQARVKAIQEQEEASMQESPVQNIRRDPPQEQERPNAPPPPPPPAPQQPTQAQPQAQTPAPPAMPELPTEKSQEDIINAARRAIAMRRAMGGEG